MSSENETTKNSAGHDRTIRAVYDDSTVRVYQAYNNAIANAAVAAQSFQLPMEMGLWSPKRMTWIKPSKVWMAYRCGWTVLKDAKQERVLALDLDRTKFEELLAKAALSDTKCRNRSVVVQWDPERDVAPQAARRQVFTSPLKRVRSVQIGLKPPANHCLLDPETVIRITDVTKDFQSALLAMKQGQDIDQVKALLWPDEQAERVLIVPAVVEENLRMTRSREVEKETR